MPDAIISPGNTDLQTYKSLVSIREVLNRGLGLDNFRHITVEGITSETPDEQKLFQHSADRTPQGGIPIVGDVYVANIDGTYIDVRSTKPNTFFKIMVILGPSIVSETSSNPADYLTTGEYIDEKIPLSIEGTGFTFSIGQKVPAQVLQALADQNYIYMTVASSNLLYRLEKATGAVTTLDPAFASSGNVAPICFDDVDPKVLWIANNRTASGGVGTSPINVKKIDLVAFTVSATYAMNALAGSTNCSRVIAGNNKIYIFFKDNTGADLLRISSINKDGTGTTTLATSIAAGGNDGAILDACLAGSNIYFTSNVGTNSLYRADNALGTAEASTSITPQNTRLLRKIAYWNGYIYGLFNQTAANTGLSYFTTVLLKYNINDNTYDLTNIVGKCCGAQIDNFLIDYSGNAWILATSASLAQVVRINLETLVQTNRFYPILGFPSSATATAGTGIYPGSHGNSLILDYDGRVMVLGTTNSTAALGDLIYFYPDLDGTASA